MLSCGKGCIVRSLAPNLAESAAALRGPRCVAMSGAGSGAADAAGAGAGSHPGAGRIITDTPTIRKIAAAARRVAVLGIKTEKQAEQPAFYVAQYLSGAGVDVAPVPVFYPDVTTILGKEVYRRVVDVPGPIDVLDVFRKPSDLPPHLEDILAARPKAVWLQSGITNPEFEAALAAAGIDVVANRCLLVEHQAAVREGRL
ncbi:MAG: CoA binding domain-containing protein [Monoraphidium minutum]|nr:MAG: CoA binding domain-containing protein [Monoraphidium minutum]